MQYSLVAKNLRSLIPSTSEKKLTEIVIVILYKDYGDHVKL